MKLTMTMDTTPRSATLRVAGDLDHLNTDEFVRTATHVLSGAPRLRELRLDFADLSFCDSAGLSGLLQVRRQASLAGVHLHLDQRPAHLDRILEITGILDHLTDNTGALAHHGAGPNSASSEDTG